MMTAEQNYRLLQEIEANRRFLLLAYQQNPKLLESAEARIKQLFEGSVLPDHSFPLSNHSPGGGRIQLPSVGIEGGGGFQRGISLVELIMFIVIVSVALAGILLVMNTVTRSSADPLIHKQALAIAESLLEEIELMPFTFCDPDDGAAASAVSVADCGTVAPVVGAEVVGTENDLTRYDPNFPYDNVSDYDSFNMAAGAIMDITNNPIGPAAGYSADVAITLAGLTLVPALPADADALRITVTVTGPDGTPVVVEGIRTRYSPRI